MNGEEPARILFEPTRSTRLLVNLEAARQYGLKVPNALVQEAAEVK
jgi:ABC-type uncharacterized transport system substrate-binding protein